MMNIKNLKNKKGFSIIEMLVSFAIFGILSVALVGFLSMSSRSYRRTHDLVNLQVEHQIVMNMLNEYIIDCDEEIIIADNMLTIVSRGETSLFTLEDGGLFMNGFPVSRHATAFAVEIDVQNMFTLVNVTMTFSPTNPQDTRTYTATRTIALRNSRDALINDGGGDDNENQE